MQPVNAAPRDVVRVHDIVATLWTAVQARKAAKARPVGDSTPAPVLVADHRRPADRDRPDRLVCLDDPVPRTDDAG
jgi:hypothetical protein